MVIVAVADRAHVRLPASTAKQGYEIAVRGRERATPRATSASRSSSVIIRTMAASPARSAAWRACCSWAASDHTITTTHRRRPGLHGRSWSPGCPSSTPSPWCSPAFLLVFLEQGASEISTAVRPEPVLRDITHRHHPVLHHRLRVLHQLQGCSFRKTSRKGGLTRECLIVSFIPRADRARACRCSSAAPARS